jgi:UDP-N-acetylmuramoyl-L-alanyl-D-glutamate--2,6-diaminopimelate ligase
MAAAAEAFSDQVVLTSDNPRSESPQAILDAMVEGLRRPHLVFLQADRALAIAHALTQAAAQDVVLLAGKGHETEQEIMGVRYPFSDVLQARMVLEQRAAQRQGAVA